MSHLSRGSNKIKDLFILREVIKEHGLHIKEKKVMHGRYIGRIPCEFVVEDKKGGELAVVKVGNEYEIQMDNWNNSICKVVGNDASLLTRDYMREVYKKEAQLLGGIIASDTVDVQGFAYIEVHTP